MTGCTINIAEFRCRAVTRATTFSNRASRRTQTFSVVENGSSILKPGAELLHDAILQQDPPIYDIGIAREAQRLRHRTVFRPISLQRKAKVLRFIEEIPAMARMRAEDSYAEAWTGRTDGPYDFPPAA